MTEPTAGADFDELYQARYLDIVATVHALAGDLGVAQELAQEAFCRAWQRWGRVARYDDPASEMFDPDEEDPIVDAAHRAGLRRGRAARRRLARNRLPDAYRTVGGADRRRPCHAQGAR